MAQFVSETRALEEQSCKLGRTYCYSSSGEESMAVGLKILEVQEDSHAHVKMLIYPPVIQKRGCMNTSWFSTIIAKLRENNVPATLMDMNNCLRHRWGDCSLRCRRN